MDRVLACGASDEGSNPSGGTEKKSSMLKVQHSRFKNCHYRGPEHEESLANTRFLRKSKLFQIPSPNDQ